MELLHSGDLYKHYKGGLYQIVTEAIHTETVEEMVVYQALYGEYKVFVRPKSMFFEMVTNEDGEAVPRFARVSCESSKKVEKVERIEVEAPSEKAETLAKTEAVEVAEEEVIEGVNPILIKFLDSETIDDKLEILRVMRKSLDDKTITDIAVTMDLVIEEGPLEERIKSLEYCLQTRARYEATRLR